MEGGALLGELEGRNADQGRGLMHQGRTLMSPPPSNQIKPNQTANVLQQIKPIELRNAVVRLSPKEKLTRFNTF